MKLLIADDDQQIREGIQEAIDWSALGVHTTAIASNGIEALRWFQDHLPEIVITDVRMPGMDGLELLRRIKETKPSTKVVILSGYDDFEYLKKAVQLDAVDYEMKPIRVRHLIALIQKVKEDIVRERVSREAFEKYRESYRAKFLDELLEGKISDRLVILQGLEQHCAFDAKGSLIGVLMRFDDSETGLSSDVEPLLKEWFPKLFGASDLKSQGLCLSSKEGEGVLLLRLETVSYLYYHQFVRELRNRFAEWNREIERSGGTSFSVGISQAGSASDLPDLIRQARDALGNRIYAGKQSLHVYEPSARLSDEPIIGLLGDEEFKRMVLQGSFDSVEKAITREFAGLQASRSQSEKSLRRYCKSLIQLFMAASPERSADLAPYILEKAERVEETAGFRTIEDYKDFILSVYREACQRSGGLKPVKLSMAMVRAEAFIRKHYASELTSEMLADHVGKTPNYFSHLFKKEFGIPFKEYVNRLRIAKAKELILHSNDLIYEISEKVGFSDYAYFTQVFKKLEGCPPTALRKGTANESRASEKS